MWFRMVSALSFRVEVNFMWNAIILVAWNFDWWWVQLKDRHLGVWNSGLWAVYRWQPISDKEQIWPEKDSDRWARFRKQFSTKTSSIFVTDIEKEILWTANCSPARNSWVFKEIRIAINIWRTGQSMKLMDSRKIYINDNYLMYFLSNYQVVNLH